MIKVKGYEIKIIRIGLNYYWIEPVLKEFEAPLIEFLWKNKVNKIELDKVISL